MNTKQRSIDSKLVLEYQTGNMNALNLLVKNWHKTFCEKAFWLVKDADAAKDIAQDSWRTIIDKINHLKNPESFGSWAMRIVYTKSLDWIHANKKSNKIYEAYKYEQDTIVTEEALDNENLKKILLASIKKLPNNQQVVLSLFYVEDYSLKEISKTLNISVGTVKSRLFKAREKLKLKTKN